MRAVVGGGDVSGEPVGVGIVFGGGSGGWWDRGREENRGDERERKHGVAHVSFVLRDDPSSAA